MSLQIRLVEGLDTPVFICQECRQQIEAADDGSYVWQVDGDGQPANSPVAFLHDRCCLNFERKRGGQWFTMPLRVLPAYLMNGLGIDREAAEATADYFASE